MGRKLTILAGLFLVGAQWLGGDLAAARGGWGVGNGGDGMRLAFAKAREHAAHVTLRLQPGSIGANVDPRVRDWLIQNHAALSADIAATQHEWTLDEKPTCAWTQLSRGAAIHLSYPTCRTRLDSFDEAAQLLVHESVHHFGIDDEDFADKVALAVYDAWRKGTTDWIKTPVNAQTPDARWSAASVWTGSEMIVHGGITAYATRDQTTVTNSAFAFDPAKNTWRRLGASGSPARYGHHAVWTGSKLILWGGYVVRGSSRIWQNNGAIYDPATDRWTELRTPHGPAELPDLAIDERQVQAVAFSGRELFVFGGAPQSGRPSGGVYDVERNAWRAINAQGAPYRVAGHSAIWTGSRYVVYGGLDLNRNRAVGGASYDPVADRWTALSEVGAPTAREGHTAVWTGTRMIVFGGFESTADVNGVGGLYDPATNSWKAIETEAVLARTGHTAVWTGSEMLIYGGKSKRLRTYQAVSAYNPSNNAWRVVETASAPEARYLHTAVWTGTAMIGFGGRLQNGDAAMTGGSFFP